MMRGLSLRRPDLNLIDSYLEEMRPGGDLQAIGHFEVNYISENQGFEGRSEYLDGVVHRVRERGLSASVHFPSFNLSEVNRKIRAVIVQEFRDALEFARRLDAGYMVVHPGYLDYYETPKVLEPDFIVRMENDLEAAFEYSADMLSTLGRLAGEGGVTVLIENLPLPRCTTRSAEELRGMRERASMHGKGCGDSIEFVLDTGHLHLTGNDMYAGIRCLSDDLRLIHVHDNNRVYDQHRIPGTGTVDWEAFRKGLRDIDFTGVVVIEINDCSLNAVKRADRFLGDLAEGPCPRSGCGDRRDS